MWTVLITAFLLAFTGLMFGQSPAPSYAPHRKVKTTGQPAANPSSTQNPMQQPQQTSSQTTQKPSTQPATPQPGSQSPLSQTHGPSPLIQKPPGNQQAPQPTVTPPADSVAQENVTAVPKVPASAPRVSYQNGELTVLAQNASLGEVLNAVRAATGMKIEGASGGGERVTAKIGPAPVRDVLLSLLEGSRYDFAMLGSETDPQRVERLVLTPRTTSGNQTYAGAQPPAAQSDTENAAAPQPGDDDDDSEGFAAPAKPAATAGSVPASAGPPTTLPAQVKTPEQLLEDLKKLEADRAQQQQNQPAATDPNAARPSRPERPK